MCVYAAPYLMYVDLDKNGWRPRKDLVMASSVQSNRGDYRRVSKEVWEKFSEFYPGNIHKNIHLFIFIYIYTLT